MKQPQWIDPSFDNIEPWIGWDNNVINIYFNKYLPLAVDLYDWMGRVSPHQDRYVYTTHPFLISLFLDCPPGMGFNCPDAATREKVLRGIRTGAIIWQAHPHNAQYELYDAALLAFSFDLTHDLDRKFGFRHKHTATLRDVPGLTRAAIPIMVSRGIKAISVGVNGGSAPPGVPKFTPFIWRDEESGTQILAFWRPGGYGGVRADETGLEYINLDMPQECIQAPGLDHVLCTSWRNDNAGPPLDVSEPLRVFELLRQDWASNSAESNSSSSQAATSKASCTGCGPDVPDVTLRASSFDDFVDAVLEALPRLNLTVVNGEIGDTWVFGVQSDPVKTANFRAAARARAACTADPTCPSDTAAFFNFSRLLVKVPEHTWGVDIKKTLHDFTNYSNADFHQCLPAAKGHGPALQQHAQDASLPVRTAPCPNYEVSIHSWDRQAAYIDWALQALPPDHPVVCAFNEDLAERQRLAAISSDQLLAAGATVKAAVSDDDVIGGLTSLVKVHGNAPGIDWAKGSSANSGGRSSSLGTPFAGDTTSAHNSNVENPGLPQLTAPIPADCSKSSGAAGSVLGQLVYSAYCEASYEFVWKHYSWQYPLPWWFPLDFGKVNSSAAWSQEQQAEARLDQVFESKAATGELLQLSLQYSLPKELVQQTGAPPELWMTLRDSLKVAVVWKNKTPTRLPEALWWSFRPHPGAVNQDSWRMHKLNSHIHPHEVILNGSQSMHAVSDDGVSVDSATGSETLHIRTLDTALVSPGKPTPFPNGVFSPCMAEGMHFNLANNVWGTNYIMWTPYSDKDVDVAFRFSLNVEKKTGSSMHT
eukprot:gene6744-6964_t